MVYNASKENPDGDIVKKIKEMGRLVNEDKITHKVPFCPRSATPLIYKVWHQINTAQSVNIY